MSMRYAWHDDAACHYALWSGDDPTADTMSPRKARHIAVTYCARCVVRDACYQQAIGDQWALGVWGGRFFTGVKNNSARAIRPLLEEDENGTRTTSPLGERDGKQYQRRSA